MRKLAALHVHCLDDSAFDASSLLVATWLREKGLDGEALGSTGVEATHELAMSRGRRGQLATRSLENDAGILRWYCITEPTDGGECRTSIHLSRTAGRTTLYVTVEAGRPDNIVSPTFVPARTPVVVRQVLADGRTWFCGATQTPNSASYYIGSERGASLRQLLTDPARTIPVVVISDFDGLVLHPGIERRMAADLAGLAVVARANADACWALTRDLGASLSCFHGAIRLYWPGPIEAESFRRHPLWTPTNLLWKTSDTAAADRMIRDTIRQRVFSAAAMGIVYPRDIEDIERAHRRLAFAAFAASEDRASVEELFDEMDRENDQLRREVAELREANSRLLTDLENAKAIQDWNSSEEIEAANETPPSTLEEAVRRVATTRSQDLLIGSDVFDSGVSGMDADAGPPEKVFLHLRALSDLAVALRDGLLGKSIPLWLAERGVNASEENAQMMRNADDRRKRTWDAFDQRKPFTLHTKPNEVTSPSKCVRIYFEWRQDLGKVVVGWVGRHP